MTSLLQNEIVILGFVFGSVLLLGIAMAGLLRRDAVAQRIEKVGSGETEAAIGKGPSMSLVYEDDRPKALKLLEPLQKKLTQSDPKQVSEARRQLIEAGYYRRSAVETFFSSRLILGVVFALVACLYIFLGIVRLDVLTQMFAVIAAAAFGYYLPALFISARVSRRREAFKMGMPDALDMMLVGVEAGLSLSASMKHVVKELAQSHPIIAEQFQIVTLEFQAGRSRSEALTALSKRMNIPVTRTLASMIVQSESLGTSLSQTLQVMAQELRTQRMLEAEKRAAELPVKMSVPLVLFIFPALMAVAMVPAVLSTLTFFAELSNK